ncbi:uncharacterized protein [Rutidosis leptorrhynchoides]|uniref:uncharacterized protein n=1 Tax=Rutidosis leptorrhynchoides TaxID=125765 RepID=UPI003A998F8C
MYLRHYLLSNLTTRTTRFYSTIVTTTVLSLPSSSSPPHPSSSPTPPHPLSSSLPFLQSVILERFCRKHHPTFVGGTMWQRCCFLAHFPDGEGPSTGKLTEACVCSATAAVGSPFISN